MSNNFPVFLGVLVLIIGFLMLPPKLDFQNYTWETTFEGVEETFLLGEYISGYDLSRIGNGTFHVRKITFFGGVADITIPLEVGVEFGLGGRNYTLVNHSSSWIKVSWMKKNSGWVEND